MNIPSVLRIAFLSSAVALPAVGQQFVALAEKDGTGLPASSSSGAASTRPSAPDAIPDWQKHFDRFIDLKEMDFALRYRSVFDSNNAHEFDQGQNRSIIAGKFKFDEQGRYGVVFHASSGHYFNWAYADFMGGGNEQAIDAEIAKATPIEHNVLLSVANGLDRKNVQASERSGGWGMSVRRLYAELEPVKGVAVEYGSLDINRGVATEITTYDNDGYIAGERLSLKRPKNLFFDEASVTYAYLGDLYTPNFFERGNRLAHANYHQFLLRKNVKSRCESSFDYTWQDKSNTLHEAIRVRIAESRVFDHVRVETYQRLNTVGLRNVPITLSGGNGFAVTVDKKVNTRFALEAGIAEIDGHSVILTQVPIATLLSLGVNGDQYGVGNRYFVRPSFKINRFLEASGFYTHDFDTTVDALQIVWNKQALNAGLVFDIKKAFFHEKTTK